MAKKPESRLQARIRRALEREFGGWWFKVWGGPFQTAGVPDLVGTVEGLFFALEVKLPKRGRVSDIQRITIDRIKSHGGAVASVVEDEEQALDIVRQALRKVGRLSAARRRLRLAKENRRTVLRAGNGENVDRTRRPRRPISRDV